MKKYYITLLFALFMYTAAYTIESHDHDAHEHTEHNHEKEHKDVHGGHEEEGGIELSSEVTAEFGIEVVAARPGILNLHTVLPGEVQVNQDQQAHIVPRYPGLVVEVRKSIGDEAKKGDVLAILEGNESLAPYELKSLIDGTIIEKHITLGESLKEDDVAFTVANLNTVWIDLTIYQKNLQAIRVGQEVIISGGNHLPDALGRISYVSPTLDAHTRTGHARVILPNPHGVWRPGLFVLGNVAVSSSTVNVLVQTSAIQALEGTPSVFIATDKGFMPRPVKLGRESKESIEILSGLTVGERYVSHGGFTLKAEMARGQLEHAGHAH